MARRQINDLKVINCEFYPKESHLVTFRDPWSFPQLYHPACNRDVPKHLADISQKVGATHAHLRTFHLADVYRSSLPVLR
jgi:syntaxin-binding protein 1